MRILTLIMLVGLGTAAAGQQQPRDQPVNEATGTASISGRVVTADTAVGVRRAIVTVYSGPNRRAVYTNVDGSFSVTALPAGTYTVSASAGPGRPQYLGATNGMPTPGGRPETIEIAAGQKVVDIVISLPRAGAISGTVVDENGEAIGRAQVSAMMLRRGTGPMQSMSVQTDDLGRYRLFGLPPGEYLVSAEMRNISMGPVEVQGDTIGFARGYAPGTTSLAQAQRIRISRGTEVVADIRLTETRLFKITGTVVDSAGQPVRSPNISVMPAEGGSSMVGGFNYSMSPDGQFTVRGLAPGRYDVSVRFETGSQPGPAGVPAPPRPAPLQRQPNYELGLVTVDVNADVEGVVVMTQPGVTVTGEFVFEEPSEGRRASLSATPASGSNSIFPVVEVADSTFTVRNLFTPVLLRANVGGVGWGMKEVLLDGRDITDEPTLFTSKDSGHLKVVLTSRTSAVEGIVTDDAGNPTRDAVVLLFGRDERTWTPRSSMTRPGGPAKDGRFKTSGLRAGEYFALALPLEAAGDLAGADRQQFSEYSKVATRLTLNPGETRSIELKVVKIE